MAVNKKINMAVMTPEHPFWDMFIDNLGNNENCNHDHCQSISILKDIPGIDIDKSIQYFKDNGGYCDCETFFNLQNNG